MQVGELFLIIDDGGVSQEQGPTDATQSKTAPPATAPSEQAPPLPAATTSEQAPPSPAATPATRRLARELKVTLVDVPGTGPGGRVTDDDVRATARRTAESDIASGAKAASPGQSHILGAADAIAERAVPKFGHGADEHIPVRGVRRRTAEAMVQAVQQIPATTTFLSADVSSLLEMRKTLQASDVAADTPITLTPFLIKATALALVRYPMANSSFDADAKEIIVRGRRNIGVATNTPDGLVIPVIKDADQKPLLAIARELNELAAASRVRGIALEDLSDGTFTITNHGPLGGKFGTPIIRTPESGILGFGRASLEPVVRDGEIVARMMLPISYSSDHRIVDGDLAIGFCQAVIDLLEHPIYLLVEGR
nr:dihydrolipoamide acetyltransferase family protein [Arthrobacter sp. V1I7]